jgi:hypothetical protein
MPAPEPEELRRDTRGSSERRPGPYEAVYDISHGYLLEQRDEPRIVRP